MFDKEVRMIWVAIYVGWAAAFGIWGVAAATDCDPLGRLSILVAAVATTATVREFFVEHDRSVKNIITVLRLGEPDLSDEHARLRPMR